MADRNRSWEERSQNQSWQQNRDKDGRSFDRSRDDYSSNYGSGMSDSRYGGSGFRSDYEGDTPYGNDYNRGNYGNSGSGYRKENERRDDYTNLDSDRTYGRSSNMGSGYTPYDYGETVGSFNQGKEGSYRRREDFTPGGNAYSSSNDNSRTSGTDYDRSRNSGSGYDSDYNRNYGRREMGSYGSTGYTGNVGRESYRDTNRYGTEQDRNRNRNTQGNRDWWDRATDEVASWFGDDDAERRRDRDRAMGPHKGKGPKGYQRADERIKDDINDRLSDDSFIDASEVDVTVEAGEVVLTGTVDSKEEKRRAEDIAERLSGVKNVENRIKVKNRYNTAPGSNIYKDRD